MMDMKTCLTPTLQKENIQTTIHTGKESSEKTLNQTMTSHIMYLEEAFVFSCVVKLSISFMMTSSHPSWCLMRLAMVQLVLVNLKTFYPMAGYDLLGKH